MAQVLEGFSLARLMRTLLVLLGLDRGLGGNISRDVAWVLFRHWLHVK